MKLQVPLLPEAASEFASQVDALYFFLVGISVVFTLGIAFAILLFVVKYRRRSDDDKPAEIHGSNLLEITWSVIPLLISMVIFFWGAHIYFDMRIPPSDAMEILVTGKQWMWKIQHPTGQREINSLHLPLGQPVKVTMTSEDVIHSFFVPAFRVKQDAVPGRYTQLWFTPTKEGDYHLFCAEYCGTQHSQMVGTVHVVSPAAYEAWLSGGAGAKSPAQAGEELFTSLGCITCHSGVPNAQGPDMKGVFGSMQPLAGGASVFADENYIRESILTPGAKLVDTFGAIMPTYQGLVTDSQITQLIAYLKSIGSNEEPPTEDEEETTGDEG